MGPPFRDLRPLATAAAADGPWGMGLYSSRLDLPGAFAEPVRCPGCLASALAPAVDGGVILYRCAACGACWRDELGWLSRVDPDECAGCRRSEGRAATVDGER